MHNHQDASRGLEGYILFSVAVEGPTVYNKSLYCLRGISENGPIANDLDRCCSSYQRNSLSLLSMPKSSIQTAKPRRTRTRTIAVKRGSAAGKKNQVTTHDHLQLFSRLQSLDPLSTSQPRGLGLKKAGRQKVQV